MALNKKDIRTAQHGVELQHRHFAFIAATLAAARPIGLNMNQPQWSYWLHMAHTFADECAGTNSKFNRARFLSACGVEG